MEEANFKYWFNELWRNYTIDEIKLLDTEEKEAILGDYEVILSKIEKTFGSERFNFMQNEIKQDIPQMFAENQEYHEDTQVIFDKILEELKKENTRQINKGKKNFVEDLGNLFSKYNINDVVNMSFDEDKELIEVSFESGAIKHINVACDSMWAMIIDIGEQLDSNPYVIKHPEPSYESLSDEEIEMEM